MAIKYFPSCRFNVTAANEVGGVRIEDPKSEQSWVLANQEARDFVKLITRRRKIAEKEFAERERALSRATWEALSRT
jgi:hypothetical protein